MPHSFYQLHIGFSTGGVVAGSIAAGVQAGIGNVAAGSTFAALQSVGALGGFSWGASALTAGAGAAVGGTAGAAVEGARRLVGR